MLFNYFLIVFLLLLCIILFCNIILQKAERTAGAEKKDKDKILIKEADRESYLKDIKKRKEFLKTLKYKYLREIMYPNVIDDNIKSMLNTQLKNYEDSEITKTSIIQHTENFTKPYLDIKGFPKQYNIIVTQEHLTNTIIVDYFQEKCRFICKRKEEKDTFLQWFEKAKTLIIKTALKFASGDITYKTIYNYTKIVSHGQLLPYYSCTEFVPDIALAVFMFFDNYGIRIRRILDMSAGRGSRMVGAIIWNKMVNGGCTYLGVDPDPCSHKYYNEMRDYICSKLNINPEAFQVINSEFEKDFTHLLPSPEIKEKSGKNETKPGFFNEEIDWKKIGLKEEIAAGDVVNDYDIMFSSPPYFDLEVYVPPGTEGAEKQSIVGSDCDSWVNNFIIVSMRKTSNMLRDGGVLAMNIENSQREDAVHYMEKILDAAKDIETLKFRGCITFNNKRYDGTLSNIFHPIWIWQKHV